MNWWGKLFERGKPNQISSERLQAIRIIEQTKDPLVAHQVFSSHIAAFEREMAYCFTAPYVPIAFALVNKASMLCLRSDVDGGLDIEGWPSEIADMPLGDMTIWKPKLEAAIGVELEIMHAPSYLAEFATQAPGRIADLRLVLEEINRIARI